MYKRNESIMKTLFFVLKRNYLITKLFIALYLVHIYVVYIYVCTYVCQESSRKRRQIYILMFYLLFGIDKIYVILFISQNTKV